MTRDEILKMEAGRELDALVAEKVMGWYKARPELVGCYWEGSSPTNRFYPDWKPSSNISAAWEVVEKMKEKGRYLGLAWDDDLHCWRVVFWWSPNPNDVDSMEEADTPMLAICRAALLAVMEL